MINNLEHKNEIMVDDEPALLCSVSNNIEASIVESLLDSHNIPVMKQWRRGGDVMMLYTGAASTGADIYVPSKLLEDAKAILQNAPETSETDEDDKEFQEYAKEHEQEKHLLLQRIFIGIVSISLVVALVAIVWAFIAN